MTRGMVNYVLVLVWLAASLGVSIKLISMKVKLSMLFFAPVLPIMALIFNTKIVMKYVKKNTPILKKIIIFIKVIFWGIKDLSVITGLVCIAFAVTQISMMDIIKAVIFDGIGSLLSNFKRTYLLYGKKLVQNQVEVWI